MDSAAQVAEASASPVPYAGFEEMPIAGRWRTGSGERALEDRNPYSDELLIRIPHADRADLDAAYRAAAAAQREWAALLPMDRATVLRRAAQVMERRREEIIGWIIREAGGTRLKAEIEWQSARDITLEAASFPHRLAGQILPIDAPGKESRVYRKPLGVVGVISPWNFPLHLTNRSLAPALACGNAVVVKPASDTPVCGGLLLAKIFEEAGLPPGALSVVIGAGSEIGDDFVTHPVPRLISFTGSTEVGRRIGHLAVTAPLMKRVELELGGNGPLVVLDDADLDWAAQAATYGKFLNAGQICMIINRIIVTAAVHDAFVDRLVARVRTLRSGDPADPATAVGPVINRRQLDGLLEQIEQAREDGARQVAGGAAQGLVLPPHVFVDVRNEMTLARTEQFGPVASVLRVADEAEALHGAPDTGYGLSSSVFTRDAERGVRFAQRLETGMAHVNDTPVADFANSPFGGEKNSGLGRFGGEWAMRAFTTDQWITLQHTRPDYPF